MYYVCGRCVPSELTRDAVDSEDRVLRNIEAGQFIAVPEYPDLSSTTKHLQIDESLTYAVIYYTAFLVSSEIMHKQIADEIINEFLSNDGRELYGATIAE